MQYWRQTTKSHWPISDTVCIFHVPRLQPRPSVAATWQGKGIGSVRKMAPGSNSPFALLHRGRAPKRLGSQAGTTVQMPLVHSVMDSRAFVKGFDVHGQWESTNALHLVLWYNSTNALSISEGGEWSQS